VHGRCAPAVLTPSRETEPAGPLSSPRFIVPPWGKTDASRGAGWVRRTWTLEGGVIQVTLEKAQGGRWPSLVKATQ
jgi:hypothetical protein